MLLTQDRWHCDATYIAGAVKSEAGAIEVTVVGVTGSVIRSRMDEMLTFGDLRDP
jgi:hypothetical protein